MSIATGISATKAGFDLLNGVRELVRRPNIDPGEISERLLELQGLMMDARNALNEALDERAKLEAKINELMRMADFGKDFTFQYGVYWRDGFPYCPVCWDVQRRTVRLSGPVPSQGYKVGDMSWSCPLDSSKFLIPFNATANKL